MDLFNYSPLQKLNFEGLDDADNIYFAHPITIDERMALIMPVARADPRHPSGIFISFCKHEKEYTRPILLFESPVHQCRTADVNAAGAIACTNEAGQTIIQILIHRNVPSRNKRRKYEEDTLQWWEWDLTELMQDLPTTFFTTEVEEEKTETMLRPLSKKRRSLASHNHRM